MPFIISTSCKIWQFVKTGHLKTPISPYSALTAFIQLFSSMSFHMSLQIVCVMGCKSTLAAFVWLSFTVYYQMCFQTACPKGWIVTMSHLFNFCPMWIFRCLVISHFLIDAKSHILHLFGFSPLCIITWFLKLAAS